jgi:hypothetical protein
MRIRTALAVVAIGLILTVAIARTPPLAGQGTPSLIVTVTDRSTDDPMPGVTVRVTQPNIQKGPGVTGPKGTVTFDGLTPGPAQVSSQRDGYLDRPQTADTNVRAGSNTVRMTLISEVRDNAYFKQAGIRIEAEGAALPANAREAFFQQEWNRIKLLRPEYQVPVLTEIKTGRVYIAKDDVFQKMVLKTGPISN